MLRDWLLGQYFLMIRTVTDCPVEVRNIDDVVRERIYPNAFSNDDKPKNLQKCPCQLETDSSGFLICWILGQEQGLCPYSRG
jgi:hypothetical protein